MKQLFVGILVTVLLSACSFQSDKHVKTTPSVDLLAKTKGDAYAFIGADVPFGRLQIGTQTRGPSSGFGYNYNDSIITGFILSYRGKEEKSQDIDHSNDIRFFPSTKNEQESLFAHSYEVVKQGYYSIYMHQSDIAVELTATKHAVFQRYFFPPTDSAQVTINKPLILINDSIATGQTPDTYFMIQFSRPIQRIVQKKANESKLYFDSTEEEMLYIKVGVSDISTSDASNILRDELPHWDFEQMAAKATTCWSEHLIER